MNNIATTQPQGKVGVKVKKITTFDDAKKEWEKAIAKSGRIDTWYHEKDAKERREMMELFFFHLDDLGAIKEGTGLDVMLTAMELVNTILLRSDQDKLKKMRRG